MSPGTCTKTNRFFGSFQLPLPSVCTKSEVAGLLHGLSAAAASRPHAAGPLTAPHSHMAQQGPRTWTAQLCTKGGSAQIWHDTSWTQKDLERSMKIPCVSAQVQVTLWLQVFLSRKSSTVTFSRASPASAVYEGKSPRPHQKSLHSQVPKLSSEVDLKSTANTIIAKSFKLLTYYNTVCFAWDCSHLQTPIWSTNQAKPQWQRNRSGLTMVTSFSLLDRYMLDFLLSKSCQICLQPQWAQAARQGRQCWQRAKSEAQMSQLLAVWHFLRLFKGWYPGTTMGNPNYTCTPDIRGWNSWIPHESPCRNDVPSQGHTSIITWDADQFCSKNMKYPKRAQLHLLVNDFWR